MKFTVAILLALSSHAWAGWSVSTYNIRNFDRDMREGSTNIPLLQKILVDVKSDVMAFEEIVNEKAFKALMTSSLPGYKYEISECGGGGKQKIAIAWDPKVFTYKSKQEDLTFSFEDGTSLACGSLRPVFMVTLAKTDKSEFTFAGVHLKAGGSYDAMSRRWEQYAKLARLVQNFRGKNLILLGDFNTTGYTPKDDDYEKFEAMLSGAGLRTMSETIGCTNYWTGTLGNGLYQASVIDHIVLQDKLVGSVQGARIGAHCEKFACRPTSPQELGASFEEVSDHCPLQVTFK